MPLISIHTIYDGKAVHLLEPPPTRRCQRVLVTFLESLDETETRTPDSARFLASFSAWQDDRSAEEIIADLRVTRCSKSESPTL